MRGSLPTVAKRGRRGTAWLDPAAILAASSVTVTACQSGRAAVRAPARAATVTKVTISPGQGSVDDRPDLGVEVSASGGRLTGVTVRDTRRHEVAGNLGSGGRTRHSTRALASPQHYDGTPTTAGPPGPTA